MSNQTTLDLDATQSRIKHLTDLRSNFDDDANSVAPDEDDLLKESVSQLQANVTSIFEELLDVRSLQPEDLDTYLENLNGVICSVETENATLLEDVVNLEKGYMEDSIRLQSNIESLNSSLEFSQSHGLGIKRADSLECSSLAEHQPESCKFKILKFSSQIEKKKTILKSLEDLDYTFKRCNGFLKFEDKLTGLEVIEYEGNQITLSLRTYIPEIEMSEQIHELAIELLDGTFELKNAEIFPNDVYIGEMIDAAKSFALHFFPLPMPQKNSLEWFVRKVQERIVLNTLRKSLVKAACNSRHSVEYVERDETIVAHMVDGFDAFIKVSQGWPMSSSPLKLISIKYSSQSSKEVTFSFLCKVEEKVNSLDVQVSGNLSTFVDAIEEILEQSMHSELQSNNNH
ncbi:uncharacterized protein [Rutidosis leptorrhynchoides]|uniref:uncharacterized protein n=1 Tax=Rutidosis leptorrhynchoides TaxID=125765 RepID=UPI003A98E07B